MLATGLAIIILLLYIIGRMGKIEEVTKSILLSKNEISSGSQSVASQNKEDFDLLVNKKKNLWNSSGNNL